MRVKNLTLAELEERVITIGFVDENLYTQVRIDCKELFDEHPDAIPSLAVKPPQGDAYPAVVTREGDIVVWNVAKSDVQYANLGRLQLTFVIGEIVAKSYVGKYVIDKSLMPDGEAPTPIENWLTQAATALQALPQEVSNSIVALMGAMVGVGETLDPDDDVTVSYDAENNTLTIGVPKGKDGDPGHTPAITAQKVGKVVTFYVDGVAVVTVSDGADGATGTTFTPSVSEEGVISWTNDGGKPNPAPRNIKGDPGKGVIPVYTPSGQTYTCDMTYQQVADAIEAGECVACRFVPNQFQDFYLPLAKYESVEGIITFLDGPVTGDSTGLNIDWKMIRHSDNGSIVYYYDETTFDAPVKPVVPTFRQSQSNPDEWECDMTFSEVEDAIAAGLCDSCHVVYEVAPGALRDAYLPLSEYQSIAKIIDFSGDVVFGTSDVRYKWIRYGYNYISVVTDGYLPVKNQVVPVFTRDMTSQTPDIWTCNMAWEDVEDAVNNGLCTTCKTVFINPYGQNENYLAFIGIHGDDEESIEFESTLTYDTEIRNMKISFHDTGTVEYTYDSFNVPQIDDEAGEGDTNKVYSASRVWADYSVMQENLGDLEDDVSDLKSQFASKADKTDTVLNTTLSRGRTPNSTVGDGSIAFGNMVQASGSQSVGFGSFIEAKGNQSFAHGYEVVARGARSSAGGYGTIAQGANSSVSGMYNVADSYENWPDWQPNTFYDAKAKVHLQVQSGGETYDYYYICKTPHTSGTTWDSHSSYWEYDNGYMNYAHIVGNGKDYRHRSNAYALDWEGNGHYAGDVYVGCNADGSGGVKLEPMVFATDSEIQDIIDEWEVSA